MQAAVDARLARLPLYTYAQLSGKHGVQKQVHRSISLASSEKHGLQWYNTLKSSRTKPLHRPAVKSAKQRQGLVWYGSLSQKKPALSV